MATTTAVIVTKKQIFITSEETKLYLPKNVKNKPGMSIMIGRKKLLNPEKVRAGFKVSK